MRASTQVAVSFAALVCALMSLSTAVTGSFEAGVIADAAGGLVREVDPQGLAWSEGIRPGQRVSALSTTDAPGGWAIETNDGTRTYRASVAAAEGGLRTTAIAAALAVLAALYSIANSRSRRRRAEPFAIAAVALSSAVYLVAQPQPTGGAILLVAGVAPIVSLVRRQQTPGWAALATAGAVGALGVAWLATYLGAASIAVVRDVWPILIAAGTAAMVALAAGVTPRRLLSAWAATRTLDAAAVIAGVLAGLVLVLAGVPSLAVGVTMLLPVALYVRSRASLARTMDRLLVADIRERAAFEAAERERARLAREIHDLPLQEVAGVIQELERHEDAAHARASLRMVAAQLRSIAADLHPPVLDDLGLAAALEGAARAAQPSGMVIEVAIDNETGYTRAERPPAVVEIAIFRMIQEALTNAVRHSGGTQVVIEGQIAPRRIQIAVLDDGIGFSNDQVAAAMRAGHLGMASMRRRAESIDAQLEHGDRHPNGTRVAVRWSA